MKIELWWSDKITADLKRRTMPKFLQGMVNRILQGQYRYGSPKKDQNYMTRLIMETKAYRRSGNREHLLNIANYAYLESICPENPKFHFDPEAKSATRRD